MASLNRWIGIGNLTKDPDLEYTQEGTARTNFTVAINRQGGEEADFIRVTAWKNQAENCAEYLSKGSPVAILGKLRTDTVEKDGETTTYWNITAQNVQFLGSARQEEAPEEKEESAISEPDEEEVPF